MAGLGRRTHYRKHLTDEVLYDFPEPRQNECIAKVVATRGGNQFDIFVDGSEDSAPKLAILPTKFRKLVWLKRNDYVIVETAAEEKEKDREGTGSIKFIISHVLYKDQVKHLQSKGLWPKDNPEFEYTYKEDEDGNDRVDDDGIVYEVYDDDVDDLMVNTNRLAKLTVQDSSSDEDSEGD